MSVDNALATVDAVASPVDGANTPIEDEPSHQPGDAVEAAVDDISGAPKAEVIVEVANTPVDDGKSTTVEVTIPPGDGTDAAGKDADEPVKVTIKTAEEPTDPQTATAEEETAPQAEVKGAGAGAEETGTAGILATDEDAPPAPADIEVIPAASDAKDDVDAGPAAEAEAAPVAAEPVVDNVVGLDDAQTIAPEAEASTAAAGEQVVDPVSGLVRRKSSMRKPGAPSPNKTVTLALDDGRTASLSLTEPDAEVVSAFIQQLSPQGSHRPSIHNIWANQAGLSFMAVHPHLIKLLVWLYTKILRKSMDRALDRAVKLGLAAPQ